MQQIDARLLRRAGWWSGDMRSANRTDQVHILPGLLQAGGAPLFIIDNPFGKADRAGHLQAAIDDALAKVADAAAALLVLPQLANPRLNGVVARLGRQIHLIWHPKLLPAHR